MDLFSTSTFWAVVYANCWIFWHLCGVIWLVTLTPHQFALVSSLGKGKSMSNLHLHDLHTSSYKMIYFLSNIYKWTLTLLIVESSLVVFAIYLMQSASLLCPD